MALQAKDLTLCQFYVTLLLAPAPNSVGDLFGWIDMIDLQIFCRTALYAGLSDQEFLATPLDPAGLKGSLLIRVRVGHQPAQIP